MDPFMSEIPNPDSLPHFGPPSGGGIQSSELGGYGMPGMGGMGMMGGPMGMMGGPMDMGMGGPPMMGMGGPSPYASPSYPAYRQGPIPKLLTGLGLLIIIALLIACVVISAIVIAKATSIRDDLRNLQFRVKIPATNSNPLSPGVNRGT